MHGECESAIVKKVQARSVEKEPKKMSGRRPSNEANAVTQEGAERAYLFLKT